MISIDRMLDIICTEAVETPEYKPENPDKSSSIDYRLELIRNPDGNYEWLED